MNHIRQKLHINAFSIIGFVALMVTTVAVEALAQSPSSAVEITGDVVEYSVDGNRVVAEGNVVVVNDRATLKCDQIEFFRDTQMAYAEGNVRLISKTGEITGDKLKFNFETMTGDFKNTRFYMHPYYGKGEKVSRVGENKMIVENGYFTTSDFDDPEYRLASPLVEIYPQEKLVARDTKIMVGKVPIMFIPRYTQRLDDKKPTFIMIPGYDKEWGMFLLTMYRYYINENIKGTLHLDAREKKDIAWGIDVDYTVPDMGKGLIRTYYMNERSITSNRFYQERPEPTIERERLKVEWRHKWDIDKDTHAILQYYRLSDDTILKDYFENEYDEDSNPKTYFLLTKGLSAGVLSFTTDARVNRFVSAVEKLPEVRYDLSNQEIGDSGFYLKNISTFSNLTNKEASPSEVRQKTKRLDIDNQISYPMKVGFIEFNPYVGHEHTYYSRAKDPEDDNSIRGIFKTGASLSTKFYRIFDVDFDTWWLDIHRLRHIITPTVNYSYSPDPTIDSAQLNSFDGIDSRTNAHSLSFSLENKLQTKRDGESWDLLRAVLSTDFYLKEHPAKGGFDTISTDIDFKPTDWLTLYFDSKYDTRKDYLTSANFDFYINGGDRWSFDLGKRWNRDGDDQITVELAYKINPKWAIKVYDRFDVEDGTQKELDLTLTRDLHSWIMDIQFSEKRTQGSEILIIFTLKAHPEIGIDIGSNFNRQKAGSQVPPEESEGNE